MYQYLVICISLHTQCIIIIYICRWINNKKFVYILFRKKSSLSYCQLSVDTRKWFGVGNCQFSRHIYARNEMPNNSFRRRVERRLRRVTILDAILVI